jgi:hypothetical protein
MGKVGKPGEQAKTGRAYRVKDGKVYEAHELKWLSDITDDEFWLCAHRDCTALMDPVAWRELKKDGEPYVMPPHFTSWDISQHHPDCRSPVEREAGEAVYHEAEHHLGVPNEIPERVVFETDQIPEVRPASDEACGAEPEKIGEVRSVPRRDGVLPDGTRGTSQSTIRKCCRVFLESDAHHAHQLMVDGCFGGRYGSVFAPLLPPRDALLAERRILYAEVFMKGVLDRRWPEVKGGKIRLPLLATVSDKGWTVRRHLEIDVSDWKPDAAEDFVRRTREAAEAGWACYLDGSLRRPWVFFVGVLIERSQVAMKVDQEAMIEVLAGEMPPHAFEEAEEQLRSAEVDRHAEASAETDRAAAAAARWAARHRRDADKPSPDAGPAVCLQGRLSPPSINLPDVAEEPEQDADEAQDRPDNTAAADEDLGAPLEEGGADGGLCEADAGRVPVPMPSAGAAGAGAEASMPGESDSGAPPLALAEMRCEDNVGRETKRVGGQPVTGVMDDGAPARRVPAKERRSRGGSDAGGPDRSAALRVLARTAKDVRGGIAWAWRWLFG